MSTAAKPKTTRKRKTKMDIEYAEMVSAPKKSILEVVPDVQSSIDKDLDDVLFWYTGKRRNHESATHCQA